MSKKSKDSLKRPQDSLKRKLTTEEITDICNVIELNKTHDKEIANCLRDNVVNNIKKQLYNIQIYPQTIPLLKKQIKQSYETSFVHPGEGVGCTAASSIGEQNTQASLNSVEYNSPILIMTKQKCNIHKRPKFHLQINDMTIHIYVHIKKCHKQVIILYYTYRSLSFDNNRIMSSSTRDAVNVVLVTKCIVPCRRRITLYPNGKS